MSAMRRSGPIGGTLVPVGRPGETVAANQAVGQILDLFGDHVADVVTPVGGVVLYVTTSPAMSAGGLMICIGAH